METNKRAKHCYLSGLRRKTSRRSPPLFIWQKKRCKPAQRQREPTAGLQKLPQAHGKSTCARKQSKLLELGLPVLRKRAYAKMARKAEPKGKRKRIPVGSFIG